MKEKEKRKINKQKKENTRILWIKELESEWKLICEVIKMNSQKRFPVLGNISRKEKEMTEKEKKNEIFVEER